MKAATAVLVRPEKFTVTQLKVHCDLDKDRQVADDDIK